MKTKLDKAGAETASRIDVETDGTARLMRRDLYKTAMQILNAGRNISFVDAYGDSLILDKTAQRQLRIVAISSAARMAISFVIGAKGNFVDGESAQERPGKKDKERKLPGIPFNFVVEIQQALLEAFEHTLKTALKARSGLTVRSRARHR